MLDEQSTGGLHPSTLKFVILFCGGICLSVCLFEIVSLYVALTVLKMTK